MKTAIEVVERMEALVRRMDIGADSILEQYDAEKTGLGQAYSEARAIVAELPEPVDPDVATARELASGAVFYGQYQSNNGGRNWTDFQDGHCDAGDVISNIVTALRRAREEGVR